MAAWRGVPSAGSFSIALLYVLYLSERRDASLYVGGRRGVKSRTGMHTRTNARL